MYINSRLECAGTPSPRPRRRAFGAGALRCVVVTSPVVPVGVSVAILSDYNGREEALF
jgi:hypothetical protein